MKDDEKPTTDGSEKETDFSVEVRDGAFDRPQDYVGLPEGGEVIFCGDEYCPKKFTDVAFSRFRMRKIATADEVKRSDGELAIIAAGGKTATENGKKVAAKTGLPIVIFAFDAGYVGYGDRKIEVTDKYGETRYFTVGKKMKIVFDPSVPQDGDRVAAGYGAICSSLVFLFEKEVRSLLCGENYDRKTAAEALRAVADMIKTEAVSATRAVTEGLAALTKAFRGDRFLGGLPRDHEGGYARDRRSRPQRETGFYGEKVRREPRRSHKNSRQISFGARNRTKNLLRPRVCVRTRPQSRGVSENSRFCGKKVQKTLQRPRFFV